MKAQIPGNLPWGAGDCNGVPIILDDGKIMVMTCGTTLIVPEAEQWTMGMADIRNLTVGGGALGTPAMYHHPDWTLNQIGIVQGIAFDNEANIFVASSLHSSPPWAEHPSPGWRYGDIGGGADSLAAAGTIYKIDATTGQPTVFAQLPQQFTTISLNVNYRGNRTLTRTTGPGLYGMAFDPDNNQLYVANIEDGKIYLIEADGSFSAASAFDPLTPDSGAAGPAPMGERVMAVEYYDGRVYYSIRNDSSFNLHIRSVAINAAGEFDITTDRVEIQRNVGQPNFQGHHEVVTDLEFSEDGRMGIAWGTFVPANPFSQVNHAAGNMIWSFDAVTGVWTQIAAYDPSRVGGGTPESYGGLDWGPYQGVDDALIWSSSADMLSSNSNPTDQHGIIGYLVANLPNSVNSPGGNQYVGFEFNPSFGDVKGIGNDVEIFKGCPPVVGIGNLVFRDNNGNGSFDGGDVGVGGVTIELYPAGAEPGVDTPVDSKTTSSDAGSEGSYFFETSSPGRYFVHVPATQFQGGGPLNGLVSSPGAGADDGTDDSGDENGLDSIDPAIQGTSSTTVQLTVDGEPLGDGTSGAENGFRGGDDGDDDNFDYTIDLGFRPAPATLLGIGNLVFSDLDGDRRFEPDDGEIGIDGVVVELYDAAAPPGTGVATQTTTTSGGGCYYFGALDVGSYIVHIPADQFGAGAALNSYVSSTGNTGDDEIDDSLGENGVDDAAFLANGISSVAIALSADGEPSGGAGSGAERGKDGDFDNIGAADDDNDLTVDFAFKPLLGLGNLVFLDDNGDGLFNPADNDLGRDDVTVELYREGQTAGVSVPLATTTTTGGGFYSFGGLDQGSYFVYIPAVEFQPGGDLEGLISSIGAGFDTGVDDSGDENGIDVPNPQVRGIQSTVVILTPGSEPVELGANGTSDDATEGFNDLTVDLGFSVPGPGIGNLVYKDENGDGIFNGADDGIPGVLVNLYTSSDTFVTSSVTGADGDYFFSGLPAGIYYVEIPGSEFAEGEPLNRLTSSLGQGADNGTDDDGDENGSDSFDPEMDGSRSSNIQLTIDGEVTDATTETGQFASSDNSDDNDNDLTVDFAFTPAVGIGNLVWHDANNDGERDAGEAGISGVRVILFFDRNNDGDFNDANEANVASTDTDADGLYSFLNLIPGTYRVEVDPVSSPYPLSSSITDTEDNREDNDDNGIQVNSGAIAASPPIVLTGGTEPTDDGDTSADTDLTVDFGFVDPDELTSLGSFVWEDRNNNALVDSGEPGLGNVLLELYWDENGDADFDDSGEESPLRTTTTNDAGNSVRGQYVFENLAPGNYQVRVAESNFDSGAALAGLRITANDLLSDANDNGEDGDDNGFQPGGLGTVVSSPVITLTVGGEPTRTAGIFPAETGSGAGLDGANNSASDASGDMTVDFGFVPLLSLGDLVWNDLDDDGSLDGGEEGIGGVTVELLYDANGDGAITGDELTPVATTMTGTAAGTDLGVYRFEDLVPGDYKVRIPGSNFAGGGALELLSFSSSVDDPADNNQNNDDNGLQTMGAGTETLSPFVNLVALQEPTNDGDGDNNTNLTVDFGFLAPPDPATQVNLGNLVWFDKNNDGVFQADGANGTPGDADDEEGIADVTVELIQSSNTTFDANELANSARVTTTDSTGIYNFENLRSGYYYKVRIPESNFADGQPLNDKGLSSTVTVTGNNSAVNDDDNGTQVEAGLETITSGYWQLTVGGEPDTPADGDDADGNLTVDFGFTRPVSVGNLVWNDLNNDGERDPGELGVEGVTVRLLWDANGNGSFSGGTPLGGAENNFRNVVTDDDGRYLFEGLAPGQYRIDILASNFGSGQPLNGIRLSSGPTDTSDNQEDNDDNGIQTSLAGLTSSPIISLIVGDEPTDDGDVDSDSDLTIDFGFVSDADLVSVGSYVWEDRNNNGQFDTGEPGLPNVLLELYWDENEDGDFLDNGEDMPLRTTLSVANGTYEFENLFPGNYQIRIPVSNFETGGALENNTISSNDALSDSADNGEDSDDNGFQPGGRETVVNSPIIQLRVDDEPTFSAGIFPAENGAGENQDGRNTSADRSGDMTVDFGFIPLVDIGDLVWTDTDNDGIKDGPEVGIDGVVVELLFDADANGIIEGAELTPVLTDTTEGGGLYLFENVVPGFYQVRIPESNFDVSAALEGVPFSSGVDTPNDITNNRDKGIQVSGPGAVVVSPIFEMVGNGEPNNDGDSDRDTNLTIDFGFTPTPANFVNIGNLVFFDRNNDGFSDPDGLDDDSGTLEDNEPGVQGVVMELIQAVANNSTQPTAAQLANPIRVTVTDSSGFYNFDNLVSGYSYKVRVAASNFLPGGALENLSLSSTVTVGGNNSAIDSDDNGVQSSAGESAISGLYRLITGSEPDTPVDGDGTDGNLTVDFGFTRPVSIGNLVWNDVNNDGERDDGEAGIEGVTVNLVNTVNFTTIATTTTDENGNYLFEGQAPGMYRVYIPAAGNFGGVNPLAVLTLSSSPTQEIDDQEDNDDNGIQTSAGAFVVSNPFTVSVGGESIIDGDTDPDSELTIDFGFVDPLGLTSVGSYVFEDRDNDALWVNTTTDPVLNNVIVELYWDENGDGDFDDPGENTALRSTVTSGSNGGITSGYFFNYLFPGNYQVRIPVENFAAGGALENHTISSNDLLSDPNDNGEDNDDNGFQPGGAGTVVVSPLINLAVGAEPTFTASSSVPPDAFPVERGPGERFEGFNTDIDRNGDMTVDFGFVPLVSIGNLVWNDLDDDSVKDALEPGLPGVMVELLFDANGDGVIDGAELTPIAMDTTDGLGEYLFENLVPGNYQIRIPIKNFEDNTGTGGDLGVLVNLPFSSGLDDPSDNRQNNDDNGIQISGPGTETISPLINLSGGSEGETSGGNDGDNDRDSSIDFGFLLVPSNVVNVGNLVWFDRNNDGLSDPDGLDDNLATLEDNEPGIEGVLVELIQGGFNGGGPNADQLANPIRTLTTDSNGFYNFENLKDRYGYRVRVAASNFAPGGALENLALSSTVTQTGNNNNTDNDDNGIQGATGEEAISPIHLIRVNTEPDVAADGDDRNGNLTIDFGFTRPVSIGNLVWEDTNNDGERDAGEPGIQGVTVNLVGPTNLTTIATTTTDENGNYLFEGLPPGMYRVYIPTSGNFGGTNPLAELTLSSSPTEETDNQADNDDNGLQTSVAAFVISPILRVSVGGESTTDGDVDPDTELTVDFGFVDPNGLTSLGSFVFLDRNNDSLFAAGDIAAPAGVVVEIYWDENGDGDFDDLGEDSPLRTTTTTGTTGINDGYFFNNLVPGNYQVRIPVENFAPGGALENSAISSNDLIDVDLDNGVDNDDNGSQPGGIGTVVSSPVINLSVDAEPTYTASSSLPPGAFPNERGPGENRDGRNTAADRSGDMTVDFGFVPLMSIGNFVFNDANFSSTATGTELTSGGVNGVVMELLFDSDNNGVIEGAELTAVATTTTTDDPDTSNPGFYLFEDLIPGNYRVRIPLVNFEDNTGTGGDLGALVEIPFSSLVDDIEDNNQNNDDNGIQLGGQGTETISPLINLTGNAEATNDGDNDRDRDSSVDFGFHDQPSNVVNIGNLVFFDRNNDGLFDPDGEDDNSGNDDDETPIQGVVVDLIQGFFNSNGTPNAVRFDNPIRSTVTDSSGIYGFENLQPSYGYVVRIPEVNFLPGGALENLALSSTVTVGGNNSAIDNDDNGNQANAGEETRSGVYFLSSNGEPNIPVDGDGRDGNLTVDFGFTRPLTLGNLVWNDVNNDGERDAGEAGIEDVLVQLLGETGNGVLAFTDTDENGFYQFEGLAPRNYRVRIPTSGNTGSGQALEIFRLSSGPTDTVDNGEDNDDNGIQASVTSVTDSPVITLALDTESIIDGDTNADTDLTVDFGFLDPEGLTSLGSFVFLDRNNDGIYAGTDTSAPVGVVVELYWDENGDGDFDDPGEDSPLRTTSTIGTTGINHGYIFTNLVPGSYQVRIPEANFLAGGALEFLQSSSNDAIDDDADNGEDNDDNGTQVSGPGTVVVSPLINLATGEEPIYTSDGTFLNERGPGENLDGRNTVADASGDMTVDFGFVPRVRIGDLVWQDTNNNGIVNAIGSEPRIGGVVVELLFDANNNGAIDGAETTAVATTTTSTGGGANAGLYLFDDLEPGQYAVRIPQVNFDTGGVLENLPLSSAINTLDDVTNNRDKGLQDDGVGTAAVSPVFQMIANSEPNNDGDDRDGNLTIDFGFLEVPTDVVNIGNLVWCDLNNDGTYDSDGLNDIPGDADDEVGIEGVVMELIQSTNTTFDATELANPVRTTSTSSDGLYGFDNLLPLQYYRVRVSAVNFLPGGALETKALSSTTTVANNENNTDNDDNGVQDPNNLSSISGYHRLLLGSEPITDGDGNNGNLTVDFGFVESVSLGNIVWHDVNNNGFRDAGEEGIPNVAVRLLYDANGNGTFSGGTETNFRNTVTDENGNYSFAGLAPGDYRVDILSTNFSAGQPLNLLRLSSTATDALDNREDDDDNGAQTSVATAVASPIISLAVGDEPDGDPDIDGDSNANTDFTIDFGFVDDRQLVSLGSFVWQDNNNDARYTSGEVGVANVTLDLYWDENGDGDFLDGEEITPIRSAQTVGGQGSGSGYLFNNLFPGNYQVRIPTTNFVTGEALQNLLRSSSDVLDSDADDGIDGDDNGTQSAGSATEVVSPVINLALGGEPTFTPSPSTPPSLFPAENGPGDNFDGRNTAADRNGDMTIDFGFIPSVSIGNLVWNDLNDDGFFQTATEDGIGGVTVELLFDANGDGVIDGAELTPVASQLTDATVGVTLGTYLFNDLVPGSYQVRIPDANFAGPLSTLPYSSSVDDPFDNRQNNDDNGRQLLGVGTETISPVINLTAGAEPAAGTDGDDNNGDATVDFGFLATPPERVNIGNLVWYDKNNDGLVQADGVDGFAGNGDDENGIEGVLVELLQSVNTGFDLVGPNNVTRTQLTDSEGNYAFNDLRPLHYYRVRIAESNFLPGGVLEEINSSSTVTNTGNENNVDNDDNGIQTAAGLSTYSPYHRLRVTLEPDTEIDGDGTNGNLTVDFGFNKRLVIGDLVWNDLNEDGVKDPTEPGFDGVDLILYNSDGTVAGTTTTDEFGNYLFDETNVPNGSGTLDDGVTAGTKYFITINPAEFAPGGTLEGFDSTLLGQGTSASDSDLDDVIVPTQGQVSGICITTGEVDDLTFDFGLKPTDEQYDYGDLPEGGSKDFPTQGIDPADRPRHLLGSGITLGITVDSETNGQPNDSATGDGGDEDAFVSFPNLAPGLTYTVPFTAVVPATILDPVYLNAWVDFNCDGILDLTEKIVSGQLVVNGDNTVTFTVPKDSEPGQTFARFRISTTEVLEPTGDAPDGEVEDWVMQILKPTGAVGNYVWLDENSDGLQDAGEPGLPNVQVQLFLDPDDGGPMTPMLISTTVTDTEGNYLFDDLPAGCYYVKVVADTVTSGLTQTETFTNGTGDFGNKDQSGDGYKIDLGPEETDPTADFGYNWNPTDDVTNPGGSPTAAVGDRIWADTDRDGAQDPSEPGIPGVLVVLTSPGPDGAFGTADDPSPVTTTTDVNGNYIFDGLTPGGYIVTVDPTNFDPDGPLEGLTQYGDPDHFGEAGGDNDNTTSAPVILGPGDVFLNVDFGYDDAAGPDDLFLGTLGRIGDRVWLDVNNSADANEGVKPVLPGDEPGISGVTVVLVRDANKNGVFEITEKIIATTTTDSDGCYLFEGLSLDDGTGSSGYLVWVNDTGNKLNSLYQTYDQDGELDSISFAILTPTVKESLTEDFSYTFVRPTGTIGDTIWADLDGSGGNEDTKGPEPGIPNVLVTLCDETGDEVGSTRTDSNGNYLFTGLPFGSYSVKVDTTTLPAGINPVASYDPDGDANDDGTTDVAEVTLTSDNPINTSQDFSYPQNPNPTLGSVGDKIWVDNGGADGVIDSDESGLAGVIVTLTPPANVDAGAGLGEPLTTTTDASGCYLFTDLPFSTDPYTVTVTPPSGFTPAFDPDGGTPDNTSPVIVNTGTENPRDEDFSYSPSVQLYSIGNTIWFDTDASATNDDPTDSGGIEPPLSGVVVTLLDENGNVLATDVTDSLGRYLFENLPTADYTVRVDTATLPSGVSTVSSYENDATNNSETTVLALSSDVVTEDFSYPPLGVIGDKVFFDADENNSLSEGEGLLGVIVELRLTDGTVIDRVTTDSNGCYLFTDVPAGTFDVFVDPEDNSLPPGITNFIDPDGGTRERSRVTLPPGGSDLEQDFGYRGPNGLGSIGTLVWNDHNADGTSTPNGATASADDNEPSIEGVKIDLYWDKNSDGVRDPDEPKMGSKFTTAVANNNYLFDDLPVDDGVGGDMAYIVHVSDCDGVLNGYWHSLGNQDDTVNNESKSDDFAVVLSNGRRDIPTIDFGYYKDLARLGNFVWNDTDDDDGEQNFDQGMESVRVTLDVTYPDDTVIKLATTSDATGHYEFRNLLADENHNQGDDGSDSNPTFTITARTPSGFQPARENVTSAAVLDKLDSDEEGVQAFPIQGITEVAQEADATDEDAPASYDFGFTQAAKAVTYAQFLFDNAEALGLDDNDEFGVPGGTTNTSNDLAAPSDNPDSDAFNNLLEHALCFLPGSGVKTYPNGLPNKGFELVPSTVEPGKLDARFNQPRGVGSSVTYTVQTSTDGQTWSDLAGKIPSFLPNNDTGSMQVTIPDVTSVGNKALLRLKVEINEDGFVGEGLTPVVGFQMHDVRAHCETYSEPLMPTCLFTGAIDLSDTDGNASLTFVTSVGGGDLANVLEVDTPYYLEITSGDNVGHRFDIESFTTNSVVLATDTDLYESAPPYNTRLDFPADLAGDMVVIRAHQTIGELFLADDPETVAVDGFKAGTNVSNAGKLLLHDRTSGELDTLILTTMGWVNSSGFAPAGGTVLPPCEGIFTHNLAGQETFTIMQYGEVRTNAAVCPLKEGYNFMGAAHAVVDQSMNSGESHSREMNDTATRGFTGSGSRARADQILVWADDADGVTEPHLCYDLMFYLKAGSFDQWSLGGESVPIDRNAERIFRCDRSYMHCIYDADPGAAGDSDMPVYTIPSPIISE